MSDNVAAPALLNEGALPDRLPVTRRSLLAAVKIVVAAEPFNASPPKMLFWLPPWTPSALAVLLSVTGPKPVVPVCALRMALPPRMTGFCTTVLTTFRL